MQPGPFEETKQSCCHGLLKSGRVPLFGQSKRAINVPQPQKHPAKKLWKQCMNQIGIKSVGLQNAVNKTPLNAENKALGTNQLPVLRPGAGIQSQGCLSGPCAGSLLWLPLVCLLTSLLDVTSARHETLKFCLFLSLQRQVVESPKDGC